MEATTARTFGFFIAVSLLAGPPPCEWVTRIPGPILLKSATTEFDNHLLPYQGALCLASWTGKYWFKKKKAENCTSGKKSGQIAMRKMSNKNCSSGVGVMVDGQRRRALRACAAGRSIHKTPNRRRRKMFWKSSLFVRREFLMSSRIVLRRARGRGGVSAGSPGSDRKHRHYLPVELLTCRTRLKRTKGAGVLDDRPADGETALLLDNQWLPLAGATHYPGTGQFRRRRYGHQQSGHLRSLKPRPTGQTFTGIMPTFSIRSPRPTRKLPLVLWHGAGQFSKHGKQRRTAEKVTRTSSCAEGSGSMSSTSHGAVARGAARCPSPLRLRRTSSCGSTFSVGVWPDFFPRCSSPATQKPSINISAP